MVGFIKRTMDVLVGLVGLLLTVLTAPLLVPCCMVASGRCFETRKFVGRDRRSRRQRLMGCRRQVVRPGQPVFLRRWVWPDSRWLRPVIHAPAAWNLVRGDISICGPRLLTEDEFLRLKLKYPQQVQAHPSRPGLLGLAQLHDDPDPVAGNHLRRLELDSAYSRRLARDASLDALIILFSLTDWLGWSRSA